MFWCVNVFFFFFLFMKSVLQVNSSCLILMQRSKKYNIFLWNAVESNI